ncbi:Crp/Fnr family transcriptional regulator [Psychroserpens sp. S379A]|uniref:Crp/Fnr family transcriptional regulator n=1 Tax=Psychroserpens sp. S379A TaxID=3415137 RepID=UPI003C7B1DE7
MMITNFLKSYNILTDEDIEAYLKLAESKTLKKDDFLVKEGQTSQYIAFIKSGIFRSFYYSSESEEVTYCFTFKNTLITAYTSWILEEPSAENIQALTDMDLLLISKKNMTYLEDHYPNWIKFFKYVAELEYVNLEKRLFLLQRESAEKRYQDLLENQPEYLKLIPLHYLASYLGVTQRHLSRIRKNLSFRHLSYFMVSN